MPTYEYRCPDGHDFERFFRKISDAPAEVACPTCGKIAERRLSAGAGFSFKGSGFYLTDYGKNAHRGLAPVTGGGEGGGSGEGKSESGSDKSSSEPKASDSKPSESKSSESKSSESKSSESKSSESKPSAGSKSSDAKPASPPAARTKKSTKPDK